MRKMITIALLSAMFAGVASDADAKRKRFSLGSWGSNKTTATQPTNQSKKQYRGSIAGGAVDIGGSVYDHYDNEGSAPLRGESAAERRRKRRQGSVERGKCIPDLPKSFELHVVGVYEGTRTAGSSLRLGKKNKRAEQVDVYVARTHRPAVLVLGAYEPIVWAINASQNANIAGVLVRGYNSQAISGLPAGVPVAFSTFREGTAPGCGSYRSSYTRKGEKGAWAKEVQTVFGRSISSFHGDYRGSKVAIGRWTGLDAAPALPIDRDELIASGRVGNVSHASAGLGGMIVLVLLGGLYVLRRRVFGGLFGVFLAGAGWL